MNEQIDQTEVGILFLHIETLQRHLNRMIKLYDDGDQEGVKALIQMQKDECSQYKTTLRKLFNEDKLNEKSEN